LKEATLIFPSLDACPPLVEEGIKPALNLVLNIISVLFQGRG